MISNTKRKYDNDKIVKSRKDYYALMVNNTIEGFCTSFEIAQACAKCYAKRYGAKELDNTDVYIWEDNNGTHTISIQCMKRIRMPYNID